MAGSVRRSVRSQRARQQAPRIHPFFAICAILTALVAAGFIAPYYPIALWPKQDHTYYNENKAYGIDDTAWTNIASAIVGFSVEPDPVTFDKLHPGEDQLLVLDLGPTHRLPDTFIRTIGRAYEPPTRAIVV